MTVFRGLPRNSQPVGRFYLQYARVSPALPTMESLDRMLVRPEVHRSAGSLVAGRRGRGADRSLARIRWSAVTLASWIGLAATAVLVLVWAVAGVVVFVELVRWFAEGPAPLPAHFGIRLIP